MFHKGNKSSTSWILIQLLSNFLCIFKSGAGRTGEKAWGPTTAHQAGLMWGRCKWECWSQLIKYWKQASVCYGCDATAPWMSLFWLESNRSSLKPPCEPFQFWFCISLLKRRLLTFVKNSFKRDESPAHDSHEIFAHFLRLSHSFPFLFSLAIRAAPRRITPSVSEGKRALWVCVCGGGGWVGGCVCVTDREKRRERIKFWQREAMNDPWPTFMGNRLKQKHMEWNESWSQRYLFYYLSLPINTCFQLIASRPRNPFSRV